MTATVYKVQQRFFWRGMHRKLQQKVAECVKCIENDQVVIKRNAHLYHGGKYKEITEGGLVWYFCPKQIPGKPIELTSIWMGPFRVVKNIPPVWVKITAAHTKSREFMMSVSRLKIFRADPNLEHRRMPKDKGWEDDGDSEAEDIQPLRDRPREDIVIPIQTGAPAAAMVDLEDPVKDTAAEDVLPAI